MEVKHDAFRKGRGTIGLPKTAMQIWQALHDDPKTIEQLEEITGRKARTITRVLERLARITHPMTGECLPMVASGDGQTWRVLEVDLDAIAHALGVAGKSERQRQEHIRERRAHERSLTVSRKLTGSYSCESGDTKKV